MNKELRDQSAHLASNLLLTVLVFVPFLNILVVFLWAGTREYYQHKKPDNSFWQNIPSFNTDLFWSCVGIVLGTAIMAGIWTYILLDLMV